MRRPSSVCVLRMASTCAAESPCSSKAWRWARNTASCFCCSYLRSKRVFPAMAPSAATFSRRATSRRTTSSSSAVRVALGLQFLVGQACRKAARGSRPALQRIDRDHAGGGAVTASTCGRRHAGHGDRAIESAVPRGSLQPQVYMACRLKVMYGIVMRDRRTTRLGAREPFRPACDRRLRPRGRCVYRGRLRRDRLSGFGRCSAGQAGPVSCRRVPRDRDHIPRTRRVRRQLRLARLLDRGQPSRSATALRCQASCLV